MDALQCTGIIENSNSNCGILIKILSEHENSNYVTIFACVWAYSYSTKHQPSMKSLLQSEFQGLKQIFD